MVNWFVFLVFLGEEPVSWSFVYRERMPLFKNGIPGNIGENGKTGRSIFTMTYKDSFIGVLNIGTFQMANFANPKPGGIHDGDKGTYSDI